MIAKNDIILLLTEMQSRGINVSDDIKKTISSQSIPLDVLKKINDSRPLDITNFYEKLRKSYNDKRSKLYINIMKSDEDQIEEPKKVLTTLSALLNQILQYKADNQTLFYKHLRCEEIVQVLNIYFKSYNLKPASDLLKLFKADCKCIEMIK